MTAGRQLYSTASYQAHDLDDGRIWQPTGVNLPAELQCGSAATCRANLSQANLTDAHYCIHTPNLTGANLSQANLTNANFSGSELR